ncbi:MAG: hypothetical protein WBV82_04350 [Myxococcaceae bacterium]
MSRHDDEWKREVADNLKRAGQELATELSRGAADALTRMREERERKRSEKEAKAERRRQKEEAKRRRREARQGPAAKAEGLVYSVAAVVLLVLAFTTDMWWMVFISLGLGISAAQRLGARTEAPALPEGPQSEATKDPRAARVDEVCDKLTQAFAESPKNVREFLSSQPEQTVETLRQACHDLLRRETALRQLASPEEKARLEQEREELRERIASTDDDVVRARLVQALAALEQQRAQLAQVQKSAERLDAERLRLGHTLDGLYAQVMSLRTADAGSMDLAGSGLRVNLERLREELSALSEATEEGHRMDWSDAQPEPVSAVDGAEPDDLGRSRRERNRG